MSVIKIENLTFSYYGYVNPIFEEATFYFDTNWKTGLIGRNGIGKSTLFRLLLGEEEYQGEISKSVEFIKFPPDISDTTKTVIELFKELTKDVGEWRLFRELNLLDIDESLIYREFETLSKGEQTKILLAVLFTNEKDFLLIDEPTNHLDIGYQYQIMNILKRQNLTLLCCVHDLNIAATYCDRLILMKKKKVFDIGTPKEMLTRENINALFDIDTTIIENEKTGRLNIIFMPEI